MKERPILFNAAMVRAIIDGRKTQTRRILKPQPEGGIQFGAIATPHGVVNGKGAQLTCRFGRRGDRLWVRETFRLYDASNECACYDECRCSGMHGKPIYRADENNENAKWTPSIHMHRHESRISLEITGVRVERLQDISEEDAIAEGINIEQLAESQDRYSMIADHNFSGIPSAATAFRDLWQSVYGDSSWSANPWVWVIEFKRLSELGTGEVVRRAQD